MFEYEINPDNRCLGLKNTGIIPLIEKTKFKD